MKLLLSLAAVAALSATAFAQPGGFGPGRGGFPQPGGFGPPAAPRGGASEIDRLKAEVRELSAKIERLSNRPAPTTRPATPPMPSRDARPTGGNSDAVARQFDKIIEELRALKGMVAGGSRGGPQGPPMGGRPGEGGRPGGDRGPRR